MVFVKKGNGFFSMKKSLPGTDSKAIQRSCTRFIEKKYSILLYIIVILFAGFIIYTKPVEAVISVEMNKPLTRIPDAFVMFESQNKTEYAVVVQKSTQELFLFSIGKDYRLIDRVKCSTGEMDGPKELSGDRKTPEGVYFFLTEYEKRELSETYGTRALPIDYPNMHDNFLKRSGNSIWLHGTNKPLKDRDSNGCIVLENGNIDRISEYITLNRTPIIIVENIKWVEYGEIDKEKKKLTTFLNNLNKAIESGTAKELTAFYRAELKKEVKWILKWPDIIKSLTSFGKKLILIDKNRIMLKHDKKFVLLFDEYLVYDDQPIYIGVKKLFLEEGNPSLKITAETYQNVPNIKRKRNGKLENIEKNPLFAAASNLNSLLLDEDEIIKLLNRWAKAWSNKDLKNFADCYSDDFVTQGMNKKEWVNYKDYLNKKYKYINVSISSPSVNRESNMSIVTFIQKYKSSGYSSVGQKKLALRLEGKKWKIYREIYQKK